MHGQKNIKLKKIRDGKEETKLMILKSGTYIREGLSSSQWSVKYSGGGGKWDNHLLSGANFKRNCVQTRCFQT